MIETFDDFCFVRYGSFRDTSHAMYDGFPQIFRSISVSLSYFFVQETVFDSLTK